MSILGKTIKVTVGLVATGLDLVISASAHGLQKRYGKNELVKTVSEISSSSIRVTEKTVKTLTDAVDGGMEAGMAYLTKDQMLQQQGLEKAKSASKEIVTGVGQGLTYTAAAGGKATTSAVRAGRWYIKGQRRLAIKEFGQTKLYAKHFGKVVVIGLLAIGATDTSNPDYGVEKKGARPEDGTDDGKNEGLARTNE